jgi:hypothetical protein
MRVNIGLSRKISRDYQSTGYSVNIEGEILAPPEQVETVLKQIHGLYTLAEQALEREIDRDQSEQAIGRRDETPPPQPQRNGYHDRGQERPAPRMPEQDNQRPQNGKEEPATNKQVQYVLTLGKRQGLSKTQVEERIQEVLGKRLTVYQLTKREAGQVIEALMQEAPTNGRR